MVSDLRSHAEDKLDCGYKVLYETARDILSIRELNKERVALLYQVTTKLFKLDEKIINLTPYRVLNDESGGVGLPK